MRDLRRYLTQVWFGESNSVRTATVSICVAFELTVLFLAFLTIDELGDEIEVESLPIRHQILRL